MTGRGLQVDTLRQRARYWADRLNVRPRIIRVQQMTSKWGSCSMAGTVTLAADLSRENEAFQDFVIAHELLHLRVPNHGRLFKALLSAHVPGWRLHDAAARGKRGLSAAAIRHHPGP